MNKGYKKRRLTLCLCCVFYQGQQATGSFVLVSVYCMLCLRFINQCLVSVQIVD